MPTPVFSFPYFDATKAADDVAATSRPALDAIDAYLVPQQRLGLFSTLNGGDYTIPNTNTPTQIIAAPISITLPASLVVDIEGTCQIVPFNAAACQGWVELFVDGVVVDQSFWINRLRDAALYPVVKYSVRLAAGTHTFTLKAEAASTAAAVIAGSGRLWVKW